MAIELYSGADLSLERAMRIAPPEYALAYTWFVEHTGEIGPRPFGEHHPEGMPIRLASQRGIHKPGVSATPFPSTRRTGRSTQATASTTSTTAPG